MRKAPRGLRVKGVFRGCFEWLQEGCGRGIFSEVASNGTADTPQILHVVPRPSLVGAEEESPKRVASEAKAPQGHRREPFLRNFLGEQKVPRRRQDARRAKKPGPQAQRKPRPEGKKNPFQKGPGPQAQEKPHLTKPETSPPASPPGAPSRRRGAPTPG